jgi:hypothetical protein
MVIGNGTRPRCRADIGKPLASTLERTMLIKKGNVKMPVMLAKDTRKRGSQPSRILVQRSYWSTVQLQYGRLSRNRGRDDGSGGRNLGGSRSSRGSISSSDRCRLAVGLVLLTTFAGDMASLATAVASLASSVERTSIRSSALARDMSELAACVTLHGLCLAVASEVVGTTTLVASSRTRTTSETAAETATRTGGTATETSSGTRGRASTLQDSTVSERMQ